jgi:hypothetical protein
VERFEWWKRLAQPTRRTIARRERTHQRAVTREAAERRLPEDRTGGAEHRRPVRGRPRWFDIARRLIGGKSDNKPE